MRIGIFDSGLGGLIILKEIVKKLQQYDYVYLGDNARTPYGNRSQETIYKFTEQAVDFLFKQDCQLIIIACNTASAKALRKIQQEWLPQNYPDRRVLGVIRPVVEKAIKVAKNKIGVIGTKGTIASLAYIKEIEKFPPKTDPPLAENSQLQVVQQACPLLVPIVEEGWEKRPETKKILRFYLKPLKLAKVDTLIVGCTHYPILIKEIQGIMGKQVKVLNPGEIVADSLTNYLQRHPEIDSRLDKQTQYKFFVTDLSAHYQELGEKWFGSGIKFEKVEL